MSLRASFGRALLVLLFVGCSTDPEVPRDAAQEDGGARCTADEGCADGLFCNGAERCVDGACEAASSPCMAAQRCEEESDRCVTTCAVAEDADGDGARAEECGGNDCDDADPDRFPGNLEVCDVEGVDEDCDESTFGVRDLDDDDEPDAACCNGTSCGTDCDDTRDSVHPGAAEVCNGRDDDCDGARDEDVIVTYYRDDDGDAFGVSSDSMTGCTAPPGYAVLEGDCNDMSSGVNPGLAERCDRPAAGGEPVDENCDGVANPMSLCMCLDGATDDCPLPGRCAGGTITCVAGAWSEACSIAPIAETCNGEDDDCDGATDEDTAHRTCWADDDRDGYAAEGAATSEVCASVSCPTGMTDREPVGMVIDCAEGNPLAYPGAPERCNGRDDDCADGGGAEPDEDADGDGFVSTTADCAGGVLPRTDCHDGRDDVRPSVRGYSATPYCPQGTMDCGPTCEDGSAAPPCRARCDARLCLGGQQYTYDYDCSGSDDRQPEGEACMPMTTVCVADRACGFGGLSYGGVPEPACGSTVTRMTCGRCLEMRCSSVGATSEPVLLGCR